MRKTNLKQSVLLIYLTLIATALIFSTLPKIVVQAPDSTTVSIIPQKNIFYIDTTPVNSIFIVNATVTDVSDLWCWQIKLYFSPSMLACVNASIPPDSPFSFPVQPTPVINNVTGYVMLGASQIGAAPGVSGSGVLATITFKIISEPALGESLSCDLSLGIYGEDTYLLDPELEEIPAALEDGYFEYYKPPQYCPYLEVRPHSYNATHIGENFTFEVWVCDVHEDWEIVGFQFVLGYNDTLLDAIGYSEGTFLENFVSGGEQGVLYVPTHDYLGDAALPPDYNAWVVAVIILPDTSGNWHEPFANGTGLLISLNFTATLATVYPEEALTELNFTYIEGNPLDPTDNITSYAMNQYMEEIPFDHLTGAIYRAPFNYTLTITSSAGGTTDPAPDSYIYAAGTNVTVTAIPDAGYSFSHWTLDGVYVSSDINYTVTMDANHTLHAVFADVTPPEIVEVKQDPLADNVLENQAVKVSVNVTDYGTGVKNVTLIYTIDDWATSNILPTTFNETSGFWEVEIPGQALGTLVKYKIEAYDYAENHVVDDQAGAYYVYTVIPEFTAIAILIILLVATLSAAILTKNSKKPMKPQN